jgi:hypothetical protein
VFHPDADKQNVIMAGCADKRIYQFDLETGDAVQEYNYHLGAVNTVGLKRVTRSRRQFEARSRKRFE